MRWLQRLASEYDTHCHWLRMTRVPCDLTLNDEPEEKLVIRLYSALQVLLSQAPDHGAGRPSNAEDDSRPEEGGRDEEASRPSAVGGDDRMYTYWNEYEDYKYGYANEAEYADQDPTYASTKADLTAQVKAAITEANSTPKAELRQRQFDALSYSPAGGSASRKGLRYVRWLKETFESTGVVSIYGAIDALARGSLSTSAVVLEHVTPRSWTRLTHLVDEFRAVADDPVTVAVCFASQNASRGNKPLSFRTGGADGTWSHVSRSNQLRACAARMCVYAALTYPLLSDSSEESVLRGVRAASHTGRRAQPHGVAAYHDQLTAITKLLQQEPASWEVEMQLQCYLRFQVVNPLVVSDKARQAVSNPSHPLYELLASRLSGDDASSQVLLDAFSRLLSSKSHEDAR